MEKSNKTKNSGQEDINSSRRKFFGAGAVGAAATVMATVTPEKAQTQNSLKGKELAMVIDRHRCTRCGGCTIACKNENNVQAGFAWANKINRTVGKFPNVRYDYWPTLCNHCQNAACVRICPTKAMHKADGGITMHDPNKCIGCKSCIAACPYVVISYNSRQTHEFWRDEKELIQGCTGSAKDVAKKVKDDTIPYYNPERENNLKGSGLRFKSIVEKCTFCDHRLKQGKLPYCVERCPAQARVFGDLNDPDSEVNKLLAKHMPTRLREHVGTEPKVYYIREFNPAHSKMNKGSI